jgi:capsular polysaccharide biosynthesis protein
MVIATQLANDCEVLVVGSSVVDKTVANLETNLGMNISSAFIQSNLSVTSESNTRILDIHFTDTDPERAALVLNEVRKVASSEIMRVTKVDAVTTVYDAKVPTTPSNIPTQRDTILASVVGAVLSIAVLIVLYLMDDTIRSEDDVQRYLGLSTLAAIPVSEDLMSEAKAAERRNKNGFARFLKK